MSLFKDTFKRTTANKANDKKALEILSKKKNKQTPVAAVVPKTIKQKVEYAKDLSLQVFGNKLDKIELVTDTNRIEEYLHNTLKNGILAVDTETNGLDRIDGKIAGICLYTPGEKGIYIPVGHVSYMTNQPLKDNVDTWKMKWFFDVCNENNVKFVLHNAKNL